MYRDDWHSEPRATLFVRTKIYILVNRFLLLTNTIVFYYYEVHGLWLMNCYRIPAKVYTIHSLLRNSHGSKLIPPFPTFNIVMIRMKAK
jgi:hypothetical protein